MGSRFRESIIDYYNVHSTVSVPLFLTYSHLPYIPYLYDVIPARVNIKHPPRPNEEETLQHLIRKQTPHTCMHNTFLGGSAAPN